MHVLVGLGGNLGDPPTAFHRALVTLHRRHPVVACSSLYRTEPVGPPQPRYWNMSVVVESKAPLRQLLDECLAIEAAAGRQRRVHWGARTLDLDLLLCNGMVVRGDSLTVPHPELHRRAFALVPSAELVPGWIHPLLGESIASLAGRIGSDGVALARRGLWDAQKLMVVPRSQPASAAVS